MQLVQAWIRRGVPSTSARTRWTLGSHRRLFRLCENVTDFPNHGFLPQMSHTAAIARRGYQRLYGAIAARLLCSASREISPRMVATRLPSASQNCVIGGENRPYDSPIASGGSNTLG
jgi:hypothetical protein